MVRCILQAICLAFALAAVASAEEADKLPKEQPPRPVVPPPATVGMPPAYSVKDFGAVGDGKADDTEAIQKAIDTAVNLPGATRDQGHIFIYQLS
jgi:hypothetical protein